MLFVLLWLCSIVWSQVFWYPKHCSFCSGLLWLIKVFCVSIWTLGLIFLPLWTMSLDFDGDYTEYKIDFCSIAISTMLILLIHEQNEFTIQWMVCFSSKAYLLIFCLNVLLMRVGYWDHILLFYLDLSVPLCSVMFVLWTGGRHWCSVHIYLEFFVKDIRIYKDKQSKIICNINIWFETSVNTIQLT
jgi:hypothetical protein